MAFQIILFSLFLPYLLWPIERILPYPHIIEEAAKAGVILYLLNQDLKKRDKITLSLLIGVAFGLTEGIFYIGNILMVGNLNTFALRLIITIPFHALTSFVILFPAFYKKYLIVAGLIAAVFLHYFFNLIVAAL